MEKVKNFFKTHWKGMVMGFVVGLVVCSCGNAQASTWGDAVEDFNGLLGYTAGVMDENKDTDMFMLGAETLGWRVMYEATNAERNASLVHVFNRDGMIRPFVGPSYHFDLLNQTPKGWKYTAGIGVGGERWEVGVKYSDDLETSDSVFDEPFGAGYFMLRM